MKFYSLARRNIKEIYRDPVSILLGLVMPIALLILFSSIYKSAQAEMFAPQRLTPGITIFSFAFLIMFSAILLAKDRQSAFLMRLFAAPLKPSDFIMSYMLPFVPLAILQIVVCFIVGVFLGATFSNIFVSFLIILLIATICISLGTMIGALFTVNQVSGVGALLITAISLFSGAWTPLKQIGGTFEAIGYSLPFAHGVDASIALLKGSDFAEISHNFYIVLIYAVSTFLLAILSFTWKMKRA
ncbi:ABC transporter permease [Saccharicrinis sp. FJH2]|uniref:ABC transporter permease n=1 Tax=Saccharicrinis sp. FJH65 TaxID=3344659 RepID=UPI0035F2A01D